MYSCILFWPITVHVVVLLRMRSLAAHLAYKRRRSGNHTNWRFHPLPSSSGGRVIVCPCGVTVVWILLWCNRAVFACATVVVWSPYPCYACPCPTHMFGVVVFFFVICACFVSKFERHPPSLLLVRLQWEKQRVFLKDIYFFQAWELSTKMQISMALKLTFCG